MSKWLLGYILMSQQRLSSDVDLFYPPFQNVFFLTFLLSHLNLTYETFRRKNLRDESTVQ